MNENVKLISNSIQGIYLSYYKDLPIWLNSWQEDKTEIYSDVIITLDLKIKKHFAAFISCQKNEINYIARVRRDKKIVTHKTRIFFEKVIKLKKPINIELLLSTLSQQLRSSFSKLIEADSKEITSNQWNAIIDYLKEHNSKDFDLFKKIFEAVLKLFNSFNNKMIITNHEKDALGLCLRIADIKNQYNNIAYWDIESTSTPDFLKNIKQASMREDQMIINDLNIFDNWKLIEEFKNNIAVFSNGFNKISVMNANRTPIEKTLGVDLFYYNYRYNNYIFVQYKRLTQKGNKYKFYIESDKNFKTELDRMQNYENYLSLKNKKLDSIDDYRFINEMFYFKFCKDSQEILTKDLTKGFYLPKSFIDHYISEFDQSSISYEDIDRYFTNSVFIKLVQTGLFGSTFNQSQEVSKLLEKIISSGKSVMIITNNQENFE